jgi:hypothetical protein
MNFLRETFFNFWRISKEILKCFTMGNKLKSESDIFEERLKELLTEVKLANKPSSLHLVKLKKLFGSDAGKKYLNL